ncbi:Ldh family oxidoreductase [Prauserella cavernicola]|uniref:Ldh family oxidoreductase n=1 Tax=Prauserella cavernicola TaxID=2800127 RepID=A0A934V816_9PSEU|nr:Ldh family oxidoreductase [Prauserella cavernicola]MBK1787825.1 Ldh family oxidoreductase [Prauserella cavernicola]
MPTRPVPIADVRRLSHEALAASGIPADDRDPIVDVLLLADLFGIHTHGVHRIPQYLSRIAAGGVNARPDIAVRRLAPALATVDGDNGLGPLVGTRALRCALGRGREAGVGAVFVKGSNHFGPVMPYLYQAAGEGFAAIIASNATTTIAPYGGRATMVGNNPIGIGVPCPGGDPVLTDIALSVAARAKIRAAKAAGEAIPESWATDAEGVPTTDPAAALNGFLQPIAGHKGYGLSVMIDLLAGALSGAAYLDRVSSWSENPEQPQDLGHFFIVVDTALLGSAEERAERVSDFRARLLATPAADPDRPVQLPGQRELENHRRQSAEGVDIEIADLEALRNLARASTS